MNFNNKRIVLCITALWCIAGTIDAKSKTKSKKLATKAKIQAEVEGFNKNLRLLNESEELLRAVCFPSSTECDGIFSQLDTIISNFNICCNQLQTKLNNIIATIQAAEFCDRSIPITQANLIPTLTITVPGSYCLVESVNVAAGQVGIFIDADRVSLDLNGFNINGGQTAVSAGGHTDVRIFNGSVENTTGPGILVTTCTNVEIAGIATRSCDVGVECADVHGLLVSRVLASFGSTAGLRFLSGTRNGKIDCCTAFSIPGIGFDIDASESLLFTDCSYEQTTTNVDVIGYNIVNGSNCNIFDLCRVSNITTTSGVPGSGFLFDAASDCFCNGCIVSNDPATSPGSNSAIDGFVIGGSSVKIVCNECLALQNSGVGPTGTGFILNTAQSSCLVNCIAKNNGVDGFAVSSATNCYLRDNTAIANVANGYVLTGMGNNIFFGNYGEGNGTNWAVSTDFAPTFTLSSSTGVISPIAPRIDPVTLWDNIDVVA